MSGNGNCSHLSKYLTTYKCRQKNTEGRSKTQSENMKKSARPIIVTCHIYTNKALIKLKANESTTQTNEMIEILNTHTHIPDKYYIYK